ncbi:hypothetical protein CVT26_010117 [Gymnopilus dilepis]|uniref:Uncharacterized protein n=1 Tax=Gymnopilus dilepis TaxID=231916 RepID=A0A409YS53_9AGAR|nr:hypothetical protein CVT26_010117 [Gymnopilus dilepis]
MTSTQSTTGTFTYVLSKYSRSYPSKRTAQSNQSQIGTDLASDWQHFTNPVIRLVLDVKSARNGEIQSVRLRILWRLSDDLNTSAKQADMVFASPFLRFSGSMHLAYTRATKKRQIEGLPLKAVYRDSVVGIRYLHLREENATPVYRRFQVSFQTQLEAADFLEIIKPVCPCKINPATAPPTNVQQGPARHRPSAGKAADTECSHMRKFQQPSLPASVTQNSDRQQNMHLASHKTLAGHFAMSSSPVTRQDPVTLPSDDLSGFENRPSLQSLPASLQLDAASLFNLHRSQAATPAPKNDQNVLSSFPTSSLPSLAYSENLALAPARPSAKRTNEAACDWEPENGPPSLNASSIYNVPNATLERMVREIIYEDGFVQLLERLSEMLTVRRFLNAA